jgi:hypothetical protein
VDPKHYLFVDQRMLGRCAYCGGTPDTRDHVPSKVLLDDPLPANLPIVEACAACNRGFSLDEEYLACFLECVLVGSSDVELVRRPKVKRALSHNKRLAKRIQSAAYELSLTQLDEPREVFFLPRSAMSASENKVFERAGAVGFRGWPEVNRRAFLRACGAEPYVGQRGPWSVVQSGQYRYAVDQHGGVRVQIVLAEYLACVVDWE